MYNTLKANMIFVIFRQGHGCGEPPRIPNAQRLGSTTSITYKCDEGYTGGGRAWCQDEQWNSNGSCVSK